MPNKKSYFFGEPVEYSVDSKLRFNIPAVHRKKLKTIDKNYKRQGFYLLAADNDLVRAFPQSYTKRETEKYLRLSPKNKDRIMFFSSKLSYIDAQGRVALPAEFGGLERAVCVANGDFLDIWKYNAFKRFIKSA
jgi:DNA-binding transcriptional regulator/RsmH inhibitor MraZ